MKLPMLAYFMLSLFSSTSYLIPVLLYPAKKTDSTETSLTKFSVDSSTQLVDLSFCFWVKVNNLKGAKILDYELNDTKGFGFTLQENYGFLNLKTVDLLFDYISPHIPDMWRHFCVTYDSSGDSIVIYMDGKVTFEKHGVDALAGTEFHESLLSHIKIGKGSATFSQPFNGEFCEMMVWGRVIDREEVGRETRCKDRTKDGLQLDWRTVKLERGDTVMMKEVENWCPSEVDDTAERIVGFGQRLKFDVAATACQAIGGRREPPEDGEEVTMIRDNFVNFNEMCNSKFWVPVKQRRNSWLSMSSFSHVPYLPWRPGQPNGGRHQACVEAKFDKISSSFQGYNDLNCGLSVRCFYCTIKSSHKFTMRGMCLGSGADTQYTGRVATTVEGNRPHWKGYLNTEIAFSPLTTSWQMRDISTEKVIATYNGSFIWPVGRKAWYIEAEVCGPEGFKSHLTLSSCSSSEFTCGDGTCLLLSSKCDGISDCGDELDESACPVVEFPKQRHYKESLPPISRKGKDIVPAEVDVSIDIMSVVDIKESSMKWSCKLQLNMTWMEGRVRWRDLRDNSNLNVITNQLEKSIKPVQVLPTSMVRPNIWVARVIFSNSPDNDFSVLDDKSALTVKKVGNSTMSAWDQLEEVEYYEGQENPVTYMRKFKKDFSCSFELQTYPFDTQLCKIILQTPDHLAGLMKLTAKQVSYSGPVELLQYHVISWDMEEVEKGLEVQMVFQRRFHHHLATTFVPTFCLMIVCQSTLYFNAEHFKTTSGVTVTTMLVMYTLYQAVSHKLPPTSYIKMIDIWLIFGLILPFSVFFLLVLIDHLPRPRSGEITLKKVSQPRAVMVIIAHYVLPAIILLFSLSYIAAAVLIYKNMV